VRRAEKVDQDRLFNVIGFMRGLAALHRHRPKQLSVA
jgi:hypothetical protein